MRSLLISGNLLRKPKDHPIMAEYLFVLGRDPQLSILEIAAYLTSREISFEIKEYTKEVLLLKARPLALKEIIKELGGTQKIGIVFPLAKATFTKDELKYHIEFFGENDEDIFKEELKSILKMEHIKPLHKHIEGPKDLARHRILEEGYEFLVFHDVVYVTEAISNPRSYNERDKKPFFDAKRTISIRLARMLINISGAKPGETLLDPYCGTGTMLQEALMLGIHCIGIDNDKETCEGCNKNLYWIRRTYHTTASWNILTKDARRLATYVDKVDVAVTEPYLGPYLKKLLSYKEAEKITEELTKDYVTLLKQLAMVVQKKIVMITPVYNTQDGRTVKINLKKYLKDTGFQISVPLKGFEIPIKYHPPDTKLGREIWILEKALI